MGNWVEGSRPRAEGGGSLLMGTGLRVVGSQLCRGGDTGGSLGPGLNSGARVQRLGAEVRGAESSQRLSRVSRSGWSSPRSGLWRGGGAVGSGKGRVPRVDSAEFFVSWVRVPPEC